MPVQERARQSVDAIIAAAAQVLEERGLPGFNTKIVATRAGLNVATLYQYFENKQAVLTELFRRSEHDRTELLAGLLKEFASSDDLEPIVGTALHGLVAARRDQPGAAALRRALAASPDLQSLHRQSLHDDARAIRSMLLVRLPDLSRERALAIGEIFAHCTDAVLDLASSGGDFDLALVDELRLMMIHHLRAVWAAT